MLTEVQQTQFVVVVNGVHVCVPQPTYTLAEAVILSLPLEQRQFASILPVTTGGQQILFG